MENIERSRQRKPFLLFCLPVPRLSRVIVISRLAKVLCCAAALLALCAFAPGGPEPAPRFRAKTMSGETFSNESIKGKVVLLQFWTTWCPYCREEEKLVDSIEKEFAGKGLLVLAVDVAESKKKVQKYLAEHPRACRIVLTDDTNLAAMYAATSYPIYVVIDRNGNIAGTQRGAGGEEGLRTLLQSAGLGTE